MTPGPAHYGWTHRYANEREDAPQRCACCGHGFDDPNWYEGFCAACRGILQDDGIPRAYWPRNYTNHLDDL